MRHCATSRKVAGSVPDGVTGIIHWQQTFRPHYGPGVDSASNRNEYQEYFLGVKAAGTYGWQPYHLHVPIVVKSGSLNLLEPSRSVQGCTGIAVRLLSFVVMNIGYIYPLRSDDATVVHVNTGALLLLVFLIVYVTVMPATFRCTMFCLPICIPNMWRLK